VASEADERCYAAAMRILSYRWNGTAELRRKLRRKEFTDVEIDTVLERLAAEKWLDDERWAGAFVRDKTRRRVGPVRIRRELRAAGAGDDVVARAVSENSDPAAEREALVALCQKKMRITAGRKGEAFLRTDEGRKKLAAYLLQQGYETALVLEVIHEQTR
jgi:regulatory protein